MQKKKVIPTPKGEKTGAKSIDGFQIVTMEQFFKNEHIPKEIMETSHQLYFDLIWICTKGSGIHYVDFKPYAFEAPSVFIIKEKQIHAWEVNHSREGYLLFFTKEFHAKMGLKVDSRIINESIGECAHPMLSLVQMREIDLLDVLLKSMFEEYNKHQEGNEVLTSYLNAFLTKLQYEYQEVYPGTISSLGKSEFDRFKVLLDQNIQQSRNANFYCEKLGIRYSKLNEQAVKSSGFTLKSFIDHRIVTLANRELFQSNLNISQIAHGLGFEEVGNFSKFYKKQTGQMPKDFRLNHGL